MDEPAKYLIHADVTAEGVIEGNDVVGAIFGQTEGLLGAELDLRELQHDSKVGRIDVDVDSADGRTTGEMTVATGLDRVETALLAAALETIDQIGPCRAAIEVTEMEDVRSAKRRRIVDRATELLADLEAESATSMDIVEAVRQRVRVEDVTEYEGYPAGPRVADSDAVVVVEGRADVLQLLQYGVKNAVAVEGTDVPDPIAHLTKRRTVTVFLDGDRGGELILKELAQVGHVDYVAFAPDGTAVEDLSRREVRTALREKVAYESLVEGQGPDGGGSPDGTPGANRNVPGRERVAHEPADRDDATRTEAVDADEGASGDAGVATTLDRQGSQDSLSDGGTATANETLAEATAATPASTADGETGADPTGDGADGVPETLAGHVADLVGPGSGTARILDADATVLAEGGDAFALVDGTEAVPATVVVDGPVTQRLLDVAAQRGVAQVVGTSEGEFVKRPTSVRVRTADEF